LFAAIDVAELGKKMVPHKKVPKVCVLKTVYSSGVIVAIQAELCFFGGPCDFEDTRALFQYRSVLSLKSVKSHYSIFRQWLSQLYFVRKEQVIATDFTIQH
jgi:hypothetical protein